MSGSRPEAPAVAGAARETAQAADAARFDAVAARRRFPALRETGDRETFFDNAAGAQVPDEVVEAVRDHYAKHNVQRGGRYALSRAVDDQIAETRRLLAAFVNAASPKEILFGPNATSLTRAIAEGARPLFRPDDRVVVTQLDHESNVGPWLRLERDGVKPVFWKVRGREARLDPDDLRSVLRSGGGRVRLLAMPLASNATGRVADVAAAAAIAREAGALVFVDAVHYGPHGPIDAPALGADFLAFSGYKIFGPHMGFLWGRADVLRTLRPAREFFIPDQAPDAFEAGTQTFEGIAGMAGAMRYLASWGADAGTEGGAKGEAEAGRAALRTAMERLRAYEATLSAALLRELATIPRLSIFGEADPDRVAERVPTVAFTIDGVPPAAIVERLAERAIHARDGHMYAPRLLEASGIDPATGVVRVSLCHYNRVEEIVRLGEALRSLG
ncbi:MAG TPA: cysteine desulfurase-like protein [Candidatus Eisenbacteria bacterium]